MVCEFLDPKTITARTMRMMGLTIRQMAEIE
jgi:hypothetical protein